MVVIQDISVGGSLCISVFVEYGKISLTAMGSFVVLSKCFINDVRKW